MKLFHFCLVFFVAAVGVNAFLYPSVEQYENIIRSIQNLSPIVRPKESPEYFNDVKIEIQNPDDSLNKGKKEVEIQAVELRVVSIHTKGNRNATENDESKDQSSAESPIGSSNAVDKNAEEGNRQHKSLKSSVNKPCRNGNKRCPVKRPRKCKYGRKGKRGLCCRKEDKCYRGMLHTVKEGVKNATRNVIGNLADRIGKIGKKTPPEYYDDFYESNSGEQRGQQERYNNDGYGSDDGRDDRSDDEEEGSYGKNVGGRRSDIDDDDDDRD